MIQPAARDEFTLANDLLAEAKAYMRVEHDDDDQQIMTMLAAAIGQFERNTDITVFPTTYAWMPGDAVFTGGALAITPERRITPITSWVAAANGGDVSSAYSLSQSGGPYGVVFYSLVGEALDGLGLTIVAGYPTADDMPASIKAPIFKIAATFYEYREKFTPSNLERHPDWDNEEMAGFWVPRC